MKKRSFGLTAAALLLSLALVPLAGQASPDTNPAYRSALEQGKAEAAALLEARRGRDAYELYSRLFREEPDDDAITLGLARAAMLANRPNQAIMAYQRLLDRYPGEKTICSEVAQAYMALDDRKNAEHYMACSASENAKDKLDLLEKQYARTQVYGKLRGGVLYDTNANLGPSSNVLDLGNYRITFDDLSRTPTLGLYAGAQVDVAHRLEQTGPWWLVGDAYALVRYNANPDLSHRNTRESQWGRISAGIRHLDSNSLFDIRLKAETFDYEFDQRVAALGPEVLFVYSLQPAFQLITRAGIDRRAYSDDQWRNGYYGYIGEYARLFFGQGNHEFIAGMRYLGGDASTHAYGYHGWEGSARFVFKPESRLEISPYLTYTRENYKGPATMLENDSRRDRIWRAGVTATYRLAGGWNLEGSYQYTRDDSNSGFYNYTQHIFTAGIAWNF